jgi:hypothetical protein
LENEKESQVVLPPAWQSIQTCSHHCRHTTALTEGVIRPNRTEYRHQGSGRFPQAPARRHGAPGAPYLMIWNTPRMNGWIRQKNVYVPGGRFLGVVQVSLPTAGVPMPSCPESNVLAPPASG